MQKFNQIATIGFLCCLLLISGCIKLPPTSKTQSEAYKKLISLFKDEYQLDVKTRLIGETLWIYHPMEHPLFKYKVTKKGPTKSNQGKEKISIKYLDAVYKDNQFFVEYDIGLAKGYPQSAGYGSDYSEELKSNQRLLLDAIKRSFFDLENLPTTAREQRPPKFIVLIVADIKIGMKLTAIMNYSDFEHVNSNPPRIPHDEYSKRYINSIEGKTAIIGDLNGKHLDYTDIIWGDFLAKQIVNRTFFKYGKSDFKPSSDSIKELTDIIKATVNAYNYTEFEGASLLNLEDQMTERIPSSVLVIK